MRFALVTVCLALTACAGYRVHRLDKMGGERRLDKTAIFYALPRAVVTVDSTVTRTEVTPGRCAPYDDLALKIGLGSDDLPLVPSVKYRVTEHHIGTRSEPDPSRVFAIEADADLLNSLTQSLELSERGILGSASVESSSKVQDIAIKVIDVAANVTGKLIGLASGTKGGANLLGLEALSSPLPFDIDSPNLQKEKYSRQKQACAHIVEQVEELRKERRELLVSGQSEMTKEAIEVRLKRLDADEQAFLVAFVGTREVKEGTVSCEFLPSGKALGFDLLDASPTQGLRNIPATHCRYPRAFYGEQTIKRHQQVRNIAKILNEVYAKLDNVQKAALATVEEFDAPIVRKIVFDLGSKAAEGDFQVNVDQSDNVIDEIFNSLGNEIPAVASATEVDAKAKDKRTGQIGQALEALRDKLKKGNIAQAKLPDDWSRYALAIRLPDESERVSGRVGARVYEAGETSGFFYAVAADAIADVELKPVPAASGTGVEGNAYIDARQAVLLPQFGAITSLPAKALFANLKYDLALYPDTGAVKKFSGGATVTDVAASVGSVGSATGVILDAVAAKKKEQEEQRKATLDAQQNAEFEALQRERQILEEKKKIQDLRKELEGTAEP